MIELKSNYKGFEYLIWFHEQDGFRCGYVGLPKGHKWYGEDYDDIPVNAHGGLTFSGLQTIFDSELWWIGFDCAHYGDGLDLELVRELCGDERADMLAKYRLNVGHIWTKEDVREECLNMIDQICSKDRKSITL